MAKDKRKSFWYNLARTSRQARFLRPSLYLPTLQSSYRVHVDAQGHRLFSSEVSIIPGEEEKLSSGGSCGGTWDCKTVPHNAVWDSRQRTYLQRKTQAAVGYFGA